MKVFLRSVMALCVVLQCGGPLYAQSADADFFKGKTVRMLIGFGPGGGYDLYARLVAQHMSRHLPGNPAIVPQNMPGAGSLLVANYLVDVAPRDGTVLGAFA